MNLLAQPFRQFKLIIIFATALAAIYVFFTNLVLLQPLLLFSTLMVCFVNIIEIYVEKNASKFMYILHLVAAILSGWGLWLSIQILQNSARIIEYRHIIH